MDDAVMAAFYGRIICCVAAAAAVLIAYPCMDRIACYRALLGETHYLYTEGEDGHFTAYITAAAIPVCICLWYALGFFESTKRISWIVFPVAALLVFAVSFLYEQTKDGWNRQR